MTSHHRVVLLLAAGSLLLGCTDAGGSERSGSGRGSSTPPPAPEVSPPGASPSTPASPSQRGAAGPTRVAIVAGGVELVATLRDTAAARDLRAQLPLTLTMRDHGGVEKTGALPGPLSTADDPAGADPGAGDLGYYAPGNDLVLYYGDQSYFDGIVVLGTLQGDLDALARADGDLEVDVRAAD